jgi:hypothetical protein
VNDKSELTYVTSSDILDISILFTKVTKAGTRPITILIDVAEINDFTLFGIIAVVARRRTGMTART